MNELTIPVPKYFTDKFPGKTIEWYEKYHMKYLHVLAKYTLKPYLTVNGKVPINLPLKKMQDEMGSFQYDNKRYYIWKEFGEGSGYIQVLKKGNNLIGKNSEVDIKNTKYLELVVNTNDQQELINMFYGDCDENTIFDGVPIDIYSLNAYIKNTEHTLSYNPGNMRDTLEKNLHKAKMINMIASYFSSAYDRPTLPQIVSDSQYGRRYYKGINLQNTHKMLRHACLGNHYQYDLKTAVFAIRLMIAKDIFSKQSTYDWNDFFHTTKEYVENKDLIRSTLAEYIDNYHDPEQLIKTMMTAIGFGATTHSPTYDGTAISDIIKNQNTRENLFKDEWLQSFIQDQKDLTDLITEYYLNDRDFIESIKFLPDIKLRNRYNKKKVMSYIFQTIEYQIMDEVVKLISDSNDVLLRVHDAIYTKRKINNSDMLEIKMLLNEYSTYLELDYEIDDNGNIERQNKFKYMKDYDNDVYLHDQFMRYEKSLAIDYQNRYSDNIDVVKIKKNNDYTVEMLNTKTYEQMDDLERIEYRKIMNIQTIEDKIQKLLNNA